MPVFFHLAVDHTNRRLPEAAVMHADLPAANAQMADRPRTTATILAARVSSIQAKSRSSGRLSANCASHQAQAVGVRQPAADAGRKSPSPGGKKASARQTATPRGPPVPLSPLRWWSSGISMARQESRTQSFARTVRSKEE